jgi:alkanesulfonate monooxygenase SsuD/methylene tetrahydromethanopterin reductase-like flavin-dependent oxidoreductase (luciferase family)
MGILLSVYVSDTDEQAREEAREGVWYFLKFCLKGHLRREGRPLTSGAGVPLTTVRSYENFLKNATLGGKQLGDVESWEELDAGGSIIAGSPKTVREKLWSLVEQAGVGNLLIQFHFGNMRADLARKSMRLFATEVAPALRRDSAALFARDYPELADQPVAGAAQ